ncbi:hypothetical protein Nepgr_025322 [Nepenthes gracilis]|uniref:Uncharacterized protein n=1 Tax=Nepenthes gracilis TaxID=150966 RepID=A0AAD3T6M8_NEPGR|nr:hypothetical protein Nepgr_025322 [Nepenthes gracilis]
MAVIAGVPDFHPSTSPPNQNHLPGRPSSFFASASESANDTSSPPNPHSTLHSSASVALGYSSLSIIPASSPYSSIFPIDAFPPVSVLLHPSSICGFATSNSILECPIVSAEDSNSQHC